jgi:hypothetical protein
MNDRKESEMSGTESWVHNEYKVGREMAIQDFKTLDKKLIGQMAKQGYINELERLFGLKND